MPIGWSRLVRKAEKVRNVLLIAGTPLETTVHSSETSGTRAIPNAVQTSEVTIRSTAERRVSTTADHSGEAGDVEDAPRPTTQATRPQPSSSGQQARGGDRHDRDQPGRPARAAGRG